MSSKNIIIHSSKSDKKKKRSSHSRKRYSPKANMEPIQLGKVITSPKRRSYSKKKYSSRRHRSNRNRRISNNKLEHSYNGSENSYGDREKSYNGSENSYGDREKSYNGSENSYGDIEKSYNGSENLYGDRDKSYLINDTEYYSPEPVKISVDNKLENTDSEIFKYRSASSSNTSNNVFRNVCNLDIENSESNDTSRSDVNENSESNDTFQSDNIENAKFAKQYIRKNSKQQSIKKYLGSKVTDRTHKKVKNKSPKKSNSKNLKSRYSKNTEISVPCKHDYNKVKFNFTKQTYHTNKKLFNGNILMKNNHNLSYFNDLPPEDKYICSILSDNFIINKET